MTAQEDPREAAYERAREAFGSLEFPNKVAFLVRESVGMLADGMENVARTMQEEIDSIFAPREQRAESEDV